MPDQLRLFDHLTHKANLKHTRYGWLRLTPAYSVHLVEDLLGARKGENEIVLDPFCGTGTTALVCAQKGIASDTVDINSFLTWLATTKTQNYSEDILAAFHEGACYVADEAQREASAEMWRPPIHQIEKWWDGPTVEVLARMMNVIRELEHSLAAQAVDLLKIAFCRVMITSSSASFGHQSMSFKERQPYLTVRLSQEMCVTTWMAAVQDIRHAARSALLTPPRVMLADARHLSSYLPHNHYTCVITSPPYPNRMSYIRELRPYMYWLGYLHDAREAGELDWEAIGGTWGIATSRVGKWEPAEERLIPHPAFRNIIHRIAERSPVLSRYVHKYFYDMTQHVRELWQVTKASGDIHYIVGNSKFYDILLPVEEIFAAMFEASDFADISIRPLRKRTSKKELFEYVVSARKPVIG